MQKTNEQDYVISGENGIEFSFSKYVPYFTPFPMYEVITTPERYWLPIATIVPLFLRSLSLEIRKFSLRINKIKIIHAQARQNSVMHSIYYPDVYMDYHPICSFDFRMGMKYDLPTYSSPFVFDDRDPNAYYDIDTNFFSFLSDMGTYEWDFTKGSHVPGYGSFLKYDAGDYIINGGIICKGFYSSAPATTWRYRRLKILISITIRDDVFN